MQTLKELKQTYDNSHPDYEHLMHRADISLCIFIRYRSKQKWIHCRTMENQNLLPPRLTLSV